jgi:hypothetical protein
LLFLRGETLDRYREAGATVPPDDQGEKLRALWNAHGDDEASVARAACGNVSLWGTELARIPGFVGLVADYLSAIRRDGINTVLDALLAAERRNAVTAAGIKVRL